MVHQRQQLRLRKLLPAVRLVSSGFGLAPGAYGCIERWWGGGGAVVVGGGQGGIAGNWANEAGFWAGRQMLEIPQDQLRGEQRGKSNNNNNNNN